MMRKIFGAKSESNAFWMMLCAIGIMLYGIGLYERSVILIILGMIVYLGSTSALVFIRKPKNKLSVWALFFMLFFVVVFVHAPNENLKTIEAELGNTPYEQITSDFLKEAGNTKRVKILVEGENSKVVFIEGKRFLLEKAYDGRTIVQKME